MDTVIIDAGNDIIFLKHQLLNADLSKDRRYLYNFNEQDYTLEKINLDESRLEEKIPFEREGPNGIGSSIGELRAQNEGQITIRSANRIGLFTLKGEKLKSINFDVFNIGAGPGFGGESIGRIRGLNVGSEMIYGLIQSYDDESYAFAIIDLKDLEITKLELETFEELSNYNLVYSSNGITITFKSAVNLEQYGSKLILSNEITNELMWYDSELDSLFIKSYNSDLTANKKEKEYVNTHDTSEGLEAERRKMNQEINFMAPFWDDKSKHFYRLSFEELPTSLAEEGVNAHVYLTVLDQDLNPMGEARVPQLSKKPGKHFARDGQIWIYENMDDEMAFLRLTITEKN